MYGIHEIFEILKVGDLVDEKGGCFGVVLSKTQTRMKIFWIRTKFVENISFENDRHFRFNFQKII